MPLSPIHEAAAKALVAFLGYQSGHAQNEAHAFPHDVAQAIVDHAQDKVNAAQSIKDELARLYDRRREGHARDAAAEMAHQQNVLAARIVIEREFGFAPDQSLQVTSTMTDGELAQISALQAEPNCGEQVAAVLHQAGERVAAEQKHAAEEAAKAAAAQQATEDAAHAGVSEPAAAGEEAH